MKEEYNEYCDFEDEKESSIDIMAMVKRLWNKRKYIMIITGSFMALGLFIALFGQPVYKSTCTFVPQMNSRKNSALSTLAALTGASALDLESGSALSPLIYPQLLENADLQRELLYTKLHFEEWEEPLSLFDYYMNPEYHILTVGECFFTFTYGWPIVLLGKIIPQKEEQVPPLEDDCDGNNADPSRIDYFTKEEYDCLEIIFDKISLDVDQKEGFFELSCKMNQPIAAAELCETVFNLLEKYITTFKIEKAQQNLEYIKGRYEEARYEYEKKQMALAEFNDANRGTLSATSQTRRDQLHAEYNLAYSIFSDLSKQYIQADMQVKEDHPIISVVKSIVVANKRSNSRALTLVIWTFLGGVLAIGTVLGFDFLKKQGSKWPEWWTLEDPANLPKQDSIS